VLLASIEASAASGKAAPRQLPSSVLPEGSLWPYITQILLEFDLIQVRYCGTHFLRIIESVALGAEQTSNYIPAIQLLHHVILRLDSTSSILTSTHRTFIRLCLLAQAYTDAIDILDRPIYHLPTILDNRSRSYLCSGTDQNSTYLNPATGLTQPITVRIFLEYYLLGALSYLGVGRYKDALFFLEVVLSAPAAQNVASMLQIEAYRKWTLVGLILNGSTPESPKNVSQGALKHIKALAKPYDCVVDAFHSNDIEKLRSEIEAGSSLWQEDGNYGLMVEVYQAFRKFTILRLGRTFAALPLTAVARRTLADVQDLTETKAYLESLIAERELYAVIVDSDSGEEILRFLPPSVSLKSETEVEKALASQTLNLQVLLRHIQDTEHRMETTKEYIDYLKKLKKAKDEDKKIGGTGNGRTATVDDVDEDMMEEF
jgi:COP9 signalosome complex subunit 3